MTQVPPAQERLQTPPGVPPMPPTPRDLGPTESEIIPFRSTKISISKSGILIPLGVTAAVTVALFAAYSMSFSGTKAAFLNGMADMMYIVALYLLFCLFYAVYAYSGIRKSFFIYLIPAAITFFVLSQPIGKYSIFFYFAYPFRHILPGNPFAPAPNLIIKIMHFFFGAGLLEELVKALPGLLGLTAALTMMRNPARAKPAGIVRWLVVTTPLEGLMLGVASGAGFIFSETLFQYVPGQIAKVTHLAGLGVGVAAGFGLLLPRVLQGSIGHMAWAGISGYFIGLAARYPRSMIKLLLIGWLTAAVLHTLWDALPSSPIFYSLNGAATLLIFVGCLLKAKQLEMVRQGIAFVPTDSILVGGAPLPVAAGTLPEQHATAWGGLSQVLGVFGHANAAAATPGAFAVGAPAPTAPQAAPSALPAPKFTLGNGAERYGIVPGQTIDLAMLFPNRGLPAGTLADVTVHPQDQAIGLKNMSASTWAVALDTGATTSVANGRNVKLVANEKIKIGDVTIDVQAI